VSDFSNGTQLVFTDTSLSGSFASNATITLTFTDPAFAGISLVSSTFLGLTYGIVGDVITINITAFTAVPSRPASRSWASLRSPFLTATFNVSTTTTPEPSSFAMLAAGSAFLFWLRRKKNGVAQPDRYLYPLHYCRGSSPDPWNPTVMEGISILEQFQIVWSEWGRQFVAASRLFQPALTLERAAGLQNQKQV